MTTDTRQKGWIAEDLERSQEWIHTLNGAEIADIHRALQAAKRAGHSCASLTKADFKLPVLRARLDQVLECMENGLGFVVLRGFPAQHYAPEDMRLMYWGVGLQLGVPVSQSRQGDLLGDVKNFNTDTLSASGRGYTSKAMLSFHTDSCDVVCLLVLQTAKSGGISKIASSLAIHDEIRRTRPDLLEVLYQPYHWSWQEQQAPGELPYFRQPIFAVEQGRFSSRYIRGHIRSAQRYDDVPRLTEQQTEAMDLIDRLANEPRFHLSMAFEPGDFQFLNNHVTYHSRTEFEDHPEPERRRHLLRMWLSVPNSRPLSPAMGSIYRDRSPGAVRGGFPSRVGTHVYATRGGEV